MFWPSSARVEIAMSRAQEHPEHRITSSEVTLSRELRDELEEEKKPTFRKCLYENLTDGSHPFFYFFIVDLLSY